MSLTSIIKAGFQKEVIDHIPNPKIKISGDCVACPLTTNYALIGTAFDYLLRAEIKRRCSGTVEVSNIGRQAIARAESLLGDVITEKDLVYMKKLADKYDNLKNKFLIDGVLSDEFIETIIKYARLDEIYRSGKYYDVTKEVDVLDIADMKALYSIIPKDLVKETSHVLADTTFPKGSELVGGADVDLIIDSTLIDIKTTKSPFLTNYIWSQLVGYYILADIAHEYDRDFPVIEKVGIYFSRYGKLWEIEASYIRDNKNYVYLKDKLVHWRKRNEEYGEYSKVTFTEKLLQWLKKYRQVNRP